MKAYWPLLLASSGMVLASRLHVTWAAIVFILISTILFYPWATSWHRFFILAETPRATLGRREWWYFVFSSAVFMTAIALQVIGVIALETLAQAIAVRTLWATTLAAPLTAFFGVWLTLPLILTLPAHAVGETLTLSRAATMLHDNRWRFLWVIGLMPAASAIIRAVLPALPVPLGVGIDLAMLLIYPVEIGVLSLSYIHLTTGRLPSLETEATP